MASMRLISLVCLSLALAAADGPAVSLLTPRGELAPDCTYSGGQPDWVEGSSLIALAGSEVVAIDATSGHQLWRAREPAGRSLCALNQSDHRLILGRLPARAGDGWNFDGCDEVLSIDLANGTWLEPLAVAPPTDRQLLVAAVIAAHGRQVIAWHRWAAVDHGWRQEELIVSSIDKNRTTWTRRWPCTAPVPTPGAFLLTGPRPTAAGETVVPLLPWDDALIVCPGPTSSIQAVTAADGTDRWAVERLWEFDRDFIGPSVWCHDMRRFGRDEQHEAWRRAGTKTVNVTPEDKAAVDAQLSGVIDDWRRDFDARHSAWLAGGPWLVPRPPERGSHPAEAILVAVAIAPAHGFVRNLARVRLYDIGARGQPVALAEIPRPPMDVRTVGDQLIFAGLPRGIGAIRPFPWDGPRGGMGGGPDCLLSMAWYAEPDQGRLDAWLQGAWTPPASIGRRFAIVPCDGGAIQREGDEVLSAGLDLMALPNGTRERCFLRLGLGRVQLPTTNYERFTRSDGSIGTVTHAAVGSDVPTAYKVVGDHLIVTLGKSRQAVFTPKMPE